MRYMKVRWHHEDIEEPVLLYSEIDAGREVRKVELYSDGRMDHADDTSSSGSTQLSEILMPTVEDLAEDPEFTPETIAREEFEAIWRQAVAS